MSDKIDRCWCRFGWKVCIDSTTMAFMAELVTYLTALGRHWKSGATGGIFAVAIMLSSTFYPLPKYVVAAALLGYVLVAGFFAWREQYQQALVRPIKKNGNIWMRSPKLVTL